MTGELPELQNQKRLMNVVANCCKADWEYTEAVGLIGHPIHIDNNAWVAVVGDGANASYEWVLFKDDGSLITTSNRGYGISSIALRDGITEYWDGEEAL
ncbi:hypothetical protein [uncultured Amphritea sp.]|uniref:hypothetical protein n=1 Tax=uncultured Amphritea sp. TaxID=981605 RepID=UPI002624D3C6|nr:hypothetical protein [uncultured Amphritea sp.]